MNRKITNRYYFYSLFYLNVYFIGITTLKSNSESKSFFERSSIIKENYLLVFFVIILYYNIEIYLSLLQSNASIIQNSIGYIMTFITFILLYFPKKITKFQSIILVSLAIIIRLKLLFIMPIISSDLQRNLIFGSLFSDGWNPYLWTIEQIPVLIEQGFNPKVKFATAWITHSYDYPILAVIFFSLITSMVPADNFTAFVFAKFILILIDAVNAYLIYKIINTHFGKKEIGKKIALLYILNPLSIFLIGMEGQFEPLPLFFVLISFYLLFYTGQPVNTNINEKYKKFVPYLPFLVGITLACGFLFKYFPIIFIPSIIIYFGKRLKNTLNFLIGFVFTSVFLSLPFIFNSYYISNFILFQLNRRTNWFNEIKFFIWGVDIPIIYIFILLFASHFLIYFFNKDKNSMFVTIGSFSMFMFLYFSPSMYSWYIIWLYGGLLFIGINEDEYLQSLFWVSSLSLLVAIWYPYMLNSIIQIIIFSYIFTLKFVRENIHKTVKILLQKNPAR